MHDAPRYDPLEASPMLANGSLGAAARGGHGRAWAVEPRRTAPDRQGERPGRRRISLCDDAADLDRGQERYNIYCSPCHDRRGEGNGMVIQRGFQRQPPSFHTDRLDRRLPVISMTS